MMADFLKYLETDGGKILVILFMLTFILILLALMVVSGHPPGEAGKELASGSVGSLMGILIQYLKPSGKP